MFKGTEMNMTQSAFLPWSGYFKLIEMTSLREDQALFLFLVWTTTHTKAEKQ